MRHIRNIPGYHKDTIFYFDFVYSTILEFNISTLKDVLAHDPANLTITRKVLTDAVVGRIILHMDIIFHSDIKPRSIVKCGS